jgi:hypothetical protein
MPVESHVSNFRHSDSIRVTQQHTSPDDCDGVKVSNVQCSLYSVPAENNSIRLHALYGNILPSIQTLIVLQGHGEVTLGDMRCSQRCAVLLKTDSSGL